MVPIGEENHKGLGKRIDPDRGAGPPGVSVGTEREQFAARPAVAGVNVPAKPAPGGNGRWRLHRGHQADGFGFKDANAI